MAIGEVELTAGALGPGCHPREKLAPIRIVSLVRSATQPSATRKRGGGRGLEIRTRVLGALVARRTNEHCAKSEMSVPKTHPLLGAPSLLTRQTEVVDS
jgi:hypothetical protein